ncbi:hypothetical protein M3Y98_00157700 [Aphelenchoides besseyi]|nr:hypothetical protein M3Y98_00157700 [Aphelenchoides besseyi]
MEGIDYILKDRLVNCYQDLVRVEFNDPIPLSSSFAGLRRSRKIADRLEPLVPEIPTLGEYGIFTDGIPFYHYHIQNLNSAALERLSQNDVRLKTTPFTEAEDEKLQENWLEYCELSGIHPADAPFYFNCGAAQKKRGRGLPDRSGVQVYRRCSSLFHPSRQEGHTRPWTKEECKLLLELAPTRNWSEIGRRLNRLRSYVHKQYLRLLKEGNPVEQTEENEQEVANALELKLFYKSIVKAFRKDPIRAFIDNDIDALETCLDWDQIGRLVSWKPKKCRKKYAEIKNALIEAKSHLHENNVVLLLKHYRKVLPRPCRSLCRIFNKRKPAFRIKSKELGAFVRLFYRNHENELLTMKHPHWKFARIIQNSDAFAAYEDYQRKSIGNRMSYVCTLMHERGIFDFLPPEHRDMKTKLKLVEKLLKKIPTTRMKARDVQRLAKELIEKKGWQPSRSAFAHKLNLDVEQN